MTAVIVRTGEGLLAAVTKVRADNWRVTKKGTLVVSRGNEEVARFKPHCWLSVRKEDV